MNNKVMGMVATVAAVFLCGLSGFLMGMFIASRLIVGSGPGIYPSTISIALIAISVILMLIPVGVGFITLRKKP